MNRNAIHSVCLSFAASALLFTSGSDVRANVQMTRGASETLIFRAAPEALLNLKAGNASFADATAVKFALSDAQKKAIFDLTHGKVDFRNIIQIEASSHAQSLQLMSTRGYDSTILSGVTPPIVMSPVTSDPELSGQWWIDADNVPAAWESVTGRGVVVADCDAGYFHDESDLKDNLNMDSAFDLSDKDAPTVINDGGYVFHGTAVAAIIAGVKDGRGTNGIAYDATLVPLQNYNYNGQDDINKEEATARCILRAINTPTVNVIVLENQTSAGSSETFVGTREAVKLALMSGITIVSAGGNSSVELKAEEANDTGSIIVGALRQSGKTAEFSNFGKRVSIAAYGEKLHTLYGPNGAMGEFGGTSGATPQVAGTIALMLEANPNLTPEQVKEVLIATRITTADNANVGGKVDAAKAVERARTMTTDHRRLDEAAALLASVRNILGASYPLAN